MLERTYDYFVDFVDVLEVCVNDGGVKKKEDGCRLMVGFVSYGIWHRIGLNQYKSAQMFHENLFKKFGDLYDDLEELGV